MFVRWAFCLLVFCAHFFLRDGYAQWALAPQKDVVLIHFLPEAATLPSFSDRTQPAMYEWLACGEHPDNPGAASRCAMGLPPGASSVSPAALSKLQSIALEQAWHVDSSKLAFETLASNPSRDWAAMLRLAALDLLVAILLAIGSGWRIADDVRAARRALKSRQWWWVLAPMAFGSLWSFASHAGLPALSNQLVPREVAWPGLFSLAVVAPFYEELTYRGWLYTLRPALPWWIFALATAAPFAASHGAVALPTLYFFLSGVLLALTMHRTRSVLLAMLAHLIHNLAGAF